QNDGRRTKAVNINEDDRHGINTMDNPTGTPNRKTALPEEPRQFARADDQNPQVTLLTQGEPQPACSTPANGRYDVMVTAAGAGYGAWRGLDVTRWREDGTRDCWGQFCYIRDRSNDKTWSTGQQPLGHAAAEY